MERGVIDSRDAAVALLADALGISDAYLQTFRGRKAFQKAIYLLQQRPFSWDLGFRHSLYFRGPYSPQLADVGFKLLRDPSAWDSARTQRVLLQACAAHVSEVRDSFSGEDGELDADLLELAATLHFLVHSTFRYVQDVDQRLEKARGWVSANKPELADRVDEGLCVLRSLRMID